MIALIDSGNTRLKVAFLTARSAHAPGTLTAVQAFDRHDNHALLDWLARLPLPPRLALGTNVAGMACAQAIEAALVPYHCPMRWVVPQAQAYGLTSRYRQPEQLGADRWVAMIGVRAGLIERHTPFLLASFGTATTLDTVNAEGVFEGGLILPGPALMRQALAMHTANLPLANGVVQDFPTDTHAAISSGIAAAQAGALTRQWVVAIRRYGDVPVIYVSGGGWQKIADESHRLLAEAAVLMDRLPPLLTVLEYPVLEGLAHLAADLDH